MYYYAALSALSPCIMHCNMCCTVIACTALCLHCCTLLKQYSSVFNMVWHNVWTSGAFHKNGSTTTHRRGFAPPGRNQNHYTLIYHPHYITLCYITLSYIILITLQYIAFNTLIYHPHYITIHYIAPSYIILLLKDQTLPFLETSLHNA